MPNVGTKISLPLSASVCVCVRLKHLLLFSSQRKSQPSLTYLPASSSSSSPSPLTPPSATPTPPPSIPPTPRFPVPSPPPLFHLPPPPFSYPSHSLHSLSLFRHLSPSLQPPALSWQRRRWRDGELRRRTKGDDEELVGDKEASWRSWTRNHLFNLRPLIPPSFLQQSPVCSPLVVGLYEALNVATRH